MPLITGPCHTSTRSFPSLDSAAMPWRLLLSPPITADTSALRPCRSRHDFYLVLFLLALFIRGPSPRSCRIDLNLLFYLIESTGVKTTLARALGTRLFTLHLLTYDILRIWHAIETLISPPVLEFEAPLFSGPTFPVMSSTPAFIHPEMVPIDCQLRATPSLEKAS